MAHLGNFKSKRQTPFPGRDNANRMAAFRDRRHHASRLSGLRNSGRSSKRTSGSSVAKLSKPSDQMRRRTSLFAPSVQVNAWTVMPLECKSSMDFFRHSVDGQNGSGFVRSVRMCSCIWLMPLQPSASISRNVRSRNSSALATDAGELSFAQVPSHTMPRPPGTTFCQRDMRRKFGDV